MALTKDTKRIIIGYMNELDKKKKKRVEEKNALQKNLDQVDKFISEIDTEKAALQQDLDRN